MFIIPEGSIIPTGFTHEFETPEIKEGQEVWLNFRGINYFADIFLNGKRVNTHTHQGMYLREKYFNYALSQQRQAE